jgi:predicted permease
MDSLIFAINAVTPLIALVAIGYFLKRIEWMNGDLAKKINRLVFHVFLPATLFLNVYKIENPGSMEFGYILYAMAMVLSVFLVALAVIVLTIPQKKRRGALLQAAFRSNCALVGIPLADALFGDEGVIAATLLSAVIVPSLNALAVVSLSLFREGEEKASVKQVLLGIVKNPLIQCVAAGLAALGLRTLFTQWDIAFRLKNIQPVFTTLTYLGEVATPLSLLVLGAQFEFSAIAALRKEIIAGTLMRTLVAPLLGIGFAWLFLADHFSGAHFASFVCLFGTPAAVSSATMAQEMGSDATLAGQLLVWTTLLSPLTIFIASCLLRMAGIL